MNNQANDETLQPKVAIVSSSDEIRDFFDDMSAGRNKAIQGNPIIAYEQEVRAKNVLEMLAVKPGEVVLDIGCGNARDIAMITKSGGRVFGVDISEGMVAAARQEVENMRISGVKLQVGDATSLAFPDASFDKVLCSEVIEHIPDAPLALREMRRVLKPGGQLVLSTPNKSSWYGQERYRIWEGLLRRKWPHPCDEWRSMEEVLTLLEESHLEVCERRSVCFIPGFILTYFFLPHFLQRLLVKIIGNLELFLQRRLRDRGYTVCVVATRVVE